MTLSLVLLALFILCLIPTSLRPMPLLALCAGVFLYLAATVLHLVSDYFTGDGVTLSVLYHLRSGLQGADFSSYSGLIIYGISALLLSLVVAVGLFFWKKQANGTNRLLLPCLVVLTLALITHPFFTHLGRIGLASHGQTSHRIEEFISHDPIHLETNGLQPNMIIIYLESLERTYFDQTLFPNLISRLRNLEKKGLSFTDIRQLNSSWWTIGGMVASQCGVPLVTPSHGNSMSSVHDFYPGAVCLGDVLKDKGYNLTFMGGADLGFAGKGAFLKTHGYDTVLGSRELNAAAMKQEALCGWGIHDDKLFELAWDRVQQLAADPGRPFVLTLLTLDTHHPNGFPSPSCKNLHYRQGDNPMLNTVVCADTLVEAFVERILHSPLADNTIIVLLSDHLAMKNAATKILGKTARKNFFLIITPDHRTGRINRQGSSLDVATTLLHLLGFKGRLGLGVDLLTDTDNAPSFVARVDRPDNVLMGWRQKFLSLWHFPSLAKGFAIDSSRYSILADSRKYSLPILMTGDRELNATYYFPSQYKSLFRYLLDQSPDRPFFLVEPCERMWFFLSSHDQQKICVASGKLGGTITVTRLDTEKKIPAARVAAVAAQPSTPVMYEKNMRKLFTRILGPETVRMFDEVPNNSTIYIMKGRYGKYPNIYSGMPWIKKRRIRCVRDVPQQGDFYFLSRDIDRDQQFYIGYTLQMYRPGIGLTDFLRRHLDDTIIISAKDEASRHLSATSRSFFKKLGIDLNHFGYRDSFACILNRGEALTWGLSKTSAVILTGKKIHDQGIEKVISAGKNFGDKSAIIIGGNNVSPNRRGLNIVIQEKNGSLKKVVFDTFKQEWTGLAILHAISSSH